MKKGCKMLQNKLMQYILKKRIKNESVYSNVSSISEFVRDADIIDFSKAYNAAGSYSEIFRDGTLSSMLEEYKENEKKVKDKLLNEEIKPNLNYFNEVYNKICKEPEKYKKIYELLKNDFGIDTLSDADVMAYVEVLKGTKKDGTNVSIWDEMYNTLDDDVSNWNDCYTSLLNVIKNEQLNTEDGIATLREFIDLLDKSSSLLERKIKNKESNKLVEFTNDVKELYNLLTNDKTALTGYLSTALTFAKPDGTTGANIFKILKSGPQNEYTETVVEKFGSVLNPDNLTEILDSWASIKEKISYKHCLKSFKDNYMLEKFSKYKENTKTLDEILDGRSYLFAGNKLEKVIPKGKIDLYDKNRPVLRKLNRGEIKFEDLIENDNCSYYIYNMKLGKNSYLVIKSAKKEEKDSIAELEREKQAFANKNNTDVYVASNENLSLDCRLTIVDSSLSNSLLYYLSNRKYKFKKNIGLYSKFHNYFAGSLNRHLRYDLFLEPPAGKDFDKLDCIYITRGFFDGIGLNLEKDAKDNGYINCDIAYNERHGKIFNRKRERKTLKVVLLDDKSLPQKAAWINPVYKEGVQNIELRFLEDDITCLAGRVNSNLQVKVQQKKRSGHVPSPYLTGKNQGNASMY